MNKAFALVIAFVLSFVGPSYGSELNFKQVDGSVPLEFPKNHGAHPEYKTEWWYFVGHLRAATGETFGYELTFFRVGLHPSLETKSAWRSDSLYLTHFALTDDKNEKFYHAERSSRGNFGEAGAAVGKLDVWNGDWRATLTGDNMNIKASTPDFGFSLALTPTKPIALHGVNGFSKKGPELGEASYYSTFTRLAGTGTVNIKNKDYEIVRAQGWMDHEVTSQELPEGVAGWDWFAIQLFSFEEIMVYGLRQKDGSKSPFSKGSYVDPAGELTNLKPDDFLIEILDHWTSEKTNTTYPSKWHITIPSLEKEFIVTPTVAEQELITTRTTGVTYWEGRCLVTDPKSGQLLGEAYTELTGYDTPLAYR